MSVTYGALPEKEQIHQPSNEAPFAAIGRMLMTDGIHQYLGTGSLVRPTYVLTAGHVLHNKTGGTISFGYDRRDIPGSNARTVALHSAAIPAAYGTAGWDIGVARLGTSYTRALGFLFDLKGQGSDRWSALNTVRGRQNMMISGYPGAGPVTPSEHP